MPSLIFLENCGFNKEEKMGPLTPDIISNNLNLIVALLIGIAFGAILEQAGFSSSKKLVGLFYGYDFTVLKVFFTAGITAMIGIMALNFFGFLDVSLIYINPLFVYSAIVGGIIMGLGFILGGFCPGTSFCAAAIGKKDAMYFIVGLFLGVFAFAEGYPLFENLYKSAFMGNVTVPEILNLSPNLFAFLIVTLVFAAFYFTSFIEDKVNGLKPNFFAITPHTIGMSILALVLIIGSMFFSDRKTYLLEKYSNKENLNSLNFKIMSVDEFAFRLIDPYEERLQIFDFRSKDEKEKNLLPKSIDISIDELFSKSVNMALKAKRKINLFVANSEIEEKQIAAIAYELGYKNIYILQGGYDLFANEIINYIPESIERAVSEGNYIKKDKIQFRIKAKEKIADLIKSYKEKPTTKQEKPKRVLGGC